MKINKILIENPEITDELCEFYKEMLWKSSSKVPTSFIEALKISGVSFEMLETYLTATPRLICDFMDDRGVLILITYHENQGFSFVINGNPSEKWFDYRKEAETESVIDSIKFYKNNVNEFDEEK